MKKNIILIGFMATGKTAVGKALAKKLKFKYVSTDDLAEKAAGMKIPEIFKKYGEKRFRKIETKVLSALKKSQNAVISCGGGIVISAGNRKALKKLGTVVLLKASPAVINSRLGRLKNRPILDIKNQKERLAQIKRLLKKREDYYKKAKNFTIDTAGLTPLRAAAVISNKLSLYI
ncbi:MAG: shikimate kinase [Candidatus Margulisiibacteriota bacterium]